MRHVLPALLLAGCAPAIPGGGGIVSVNPCADAMLVRLLPPARIAAISHYSQDPAATSIPLDLARRFHATAGTAEEVIALAPDLVVASSFTAPATRDAYARAGLKTLYLDAPQTIAASEAQLRQLAAAVGAKAAGEREVAAIEVALHDTAPPPGTRRPTALLYIAGDLANGGGTLLDAMMRHVGLTNAAARYGLTFTGRLPAETIVARPPDVILAPADGRAAALRQRLLPDTPVVRFPRALVNCGGPAIAPALRRLAAIRAAA
ncbi:ABC transporter substrate-binding protein [Sphingomonas sp. KR1UV-12]|uniref:ABC transporter substrate-binding protein n=1 Tax=Sphingomonas aurea TaxID=3063994 RepID=A0ABT9EFI6_9SPHN|nr:ABC transporter substrate-binding protein [Sphingomonas sp. KR1UV-12]MDP1025728.1 ABC transporter substrate-binding protein [Sphingomonas sp. KR1UV-12]